MEEQRIRYLIQQYHNNSITPVEWQELSALLMDEQHADLVKQVIRVDMEEFSSDPEFLSKDHTALYDRITGIDDLEPVKQTPVRRMWIWKRVAVAATVLLIVGLGSYFAFFNSGRHAQPGPATIAQTGDIPAPDRNRAHLTLADGNIIYLDSAVNGTLSQQNNVVVAKAADGKISYSPGHGYNARQLVYNTLTNPKGSKVIDLALADGSRVWLNAGSSVTYPVAFIGNERKIEINGEAYFEVAKNKHKPFIVDLPPPTEGGKGGWVEVLGTHFNVNAYDDDNDITVTLLEGSVEVKNKRSKVRIVPGEQAVMAKANDAAIAVVHQADTSHAIAWKKGLFSFNNADLPAVLKQLERWYDLKIRYEGAVPDITLKGKMYRNVNLSAVLIFLQKMGVKCKMEGKTIIIQ